jgi:hypothetical protein
MEPIATYVEKRLEMSRTFELFETSIRVTGKTMTKDFDTTIPLIQISPNYTRVWFYSYLFHLATILFCGHLIVTLGMIAFIVYRQERVYPIAPLGAGVFGSVVFFVMAIINRHKLAAVQFPMAGVGIPIISIVKVGPYADEFDGFLALFLEKIQLAQDASS